MTVIPADQWQELGDALSVVPASEMRVTEWEADLERQRAALVELEDSAGGIALADPTQADELAERIAVARARIDVAESALRKAREEVVEARRNVLRVRVAGLRAQATTLRAEADQRQAKTDELVRELEDWEDGAFFLPYEQWMREFRALPAGRALRLPLTRRLRNQADQLDQRANRLTDISAGPEAPLVAHVEQVSAELADSRAASEDSGDDQANEPVAA